MCRHSSWVIAFWCAWAAVSGVILLGALASVLTSGPADPYCDDRSPMERDRMYGKGAIQCLK